MNNEFIDKAVSDVIDEVDSADDRSPWRSRLAAKFTEEFKRPPTVSELSVLIERFQSNKGAIRGNSDATAR